jgi:hypothetical protein
MRKSHPTSFRLSVNAVNRIGYLSSKWECRSGDVVERALREAEEREQIASNLMAMTRPDWMALTNTGEENAEEHDTAAAKG